MTKSDRDNMNRRGFLKASSAVLAGLAATGQSLLYAQDDTVSGMKYRDLGKTKLKVSEVSMGTVTLSNPAVVERAVDKGITLFHTSPGYNKGVAIQMMGEALKNLKSKRDKLIIAIKGSKLGDVDKELQTLNTDYVDIYVPPMEAKALANPELPEMCARLKKSGKVRFCGFTNHKGVVDSMKAALKLRWVEVILATYNLANKAEMDPVLEQLAKRGVGFIAMKTRQGVPKGQDPASTVQGLLQNKDVSSACITMASQQDVDKWAALPGKKMTLRERREFHQRLLAMSGVCGSCARCEGVCPQGVAIPDIFRFHMYATRYEPPQSEVGFEEYRRLPRLRLATNCNDCGACERVCPNAVPIRRRLKEAHELLA